MITKTYLDGRLNELEGKLKRRIALKDDRQSIEINEVIKNLKDTVKSLEEKIFESKDLMNNYLQEHNNVKDELAELKNKIENIEKIITIEAKTKTPSENNTIVSDI